MADTLLDNALSNIDADNTVVCPQCGQRVGLGPSGIENYKKQHLGSKKCKECQAKKDKKANNMKNSSLLTFFGGSKPTKTLAPTVAQPANLIRASDLSVAELYGSEASSSSPVPTNVHGSPAIQLGKPSNLVERLAFIAASLPESVPLATNDDALARLENDPASFDDQNVSGDELWETTLNPLLKQLLGWGQISDLRELVRRGTKGVIGLHRFVEYYVVKRGVSPALFEGKLDGLMKAAETL